MVIQLTLPDAQVPRIVDAFAAKYGYQATVIDGNGNAVANPVSKVAFAKQQLLNYIRDVVISQERSDALATAIHSISAPPDVS